MSDSIVGPVISAISGFLGVLVGTALVPWVRGYFSRRQAARYLAIRVVCVLDKYIDDCAAVACDWGRENQEGVSEAEVSAPTFPSYPSELDWHSIEYSVMYELLSLPSAAERVAGIVADASEHADPPDYGGYFETRSFEYSTLGLKVFDVTAKLRKRYRIPDIDRTGWDPIVRLQHEIKSTQDMREKRSAHWDASVLPHLPPPPS